MDFAGLSWSTTAPAIASSFLASLVEAIEAFTIVLAVAALRGWRPAALGAGAALLVLALLVAALGPLIGAVPIAALQLTIGVLLLLFGMGWLRKAILRAAGVIPLYDEEAAFAAESERLAHEAALRKAASRDWIGGLTAFKAVLLEGLEVAFIIVAVGAGGGGRLLWSAAIGAFAACILVLTIGALLHRPLARVPENTLKFGVGVMLAAFGVFWAGEGLGVDWPGHDLVLIPFAALFLIVGLLAARLLRRPEGAGA